MMSTKEARQHVYICQFAAPGYDEPGMAAFDNAEAAVDCEHKVRESGAVQAEILKVPIQHEVGEELKAEIQLL